jgi:large subunit ribosomal protein L9
VKVIFIEDVPDVALAGETKEVADGFGRNYLIPKKLAVLANSAASNIVEAQMKKVVQKRALAEAEMKELAEKLDGTEITLKARVGEKERLYGSVTGADIAEELGKSTGVTVDKRKIELAEPIRQLGSHDVTVRFTHEISAGVRVIVEAEQVAEEKPEKEEKKPKTRGRKKAKAPEAEAAEAEAVVEEAEARVEEAEAVVEEAEARVEEAEAVVEEAETKVEETEAEVKVEEAEEKETESGE